MNQGTYAVKEGATTVAFISVTKSGATVMPKGIKASALCELQTSLEEGVLPEGLSATAIEVETVFIRPRPNWKEITPSTGKRLRWLKSRQNRQ